VVLQPKTFVTRQGRVEAVRGVTMQVQAGEILGFLGPNGAGKTTTMRMLATLLPLSSGDAMIVGCDLRRDPAQVRRRIGYVGQRGRAEEVSTGRENLLLQGQLYALRRNDAYRRAQDLIAAFEMDAFADRTVCGYSGGQRRRLDLAMGMIHQPALLFLDEPTTGLDPQSRARLWDEVRKLRAGGTTIFLTTHYLDEADALCDRLAIIDHGQIVSEGTTAELKRKVAGDIIMLGLAADTMRTQAEALLRSQSFVRELQADTTSLRITVEHGEGTLPTVLRLLDNAGLHANSVTLARPTLNDVFLRLTSRSLRDDAVR
jgi:ABC-2 type transport system ATP-binding protein